MQREWHAVRGEKIEISRKRDRTLNGDRKRGHYTKCMRYRDTAYLKLE